MPEYNGNDVYLTVNGVNVGARWRSFEMTLNIGDENVSAGAGIDWEKHASKLKNISATMTLVYDDANAANDMAALMTANDVVIVTYGPEGNATGKPKHEQAFKYNSVGGPTTGHDKPLVVLSYAMISTGVPTANIYDGDTF